MISQLRHPCSHLKVASGGMGVPMRKTTCVVSALGSIQHRAGGWGVECCYGFSLKIDFSFLLTKKDT